MANIPLPPHLTVSRLTRAFHAFEAALGAEKVLFTDLDRTLYQDKFALNSKCHLSAGTIAPTSVAQVQAALKIATQFHLPLWPISRGKNLGHGGSAPVLEGTVMMDLSRMRAISFDGRHGTVIVEPGVSFYDLYDYLKANDLPYWLSTPANSWGSVMGNALDRGMGHTPYGENTRNICGMEVVLASGEAVRTGMGAISGAKSWAAYPYGFGPAWDQMFVQSNFGVVTKMGLWLMPEPESMMGLDLAFDRPDDLTSMIDTIAPLRRERVLTHSPSIGNWLRAAALLTSRADWTDEPGPLAGSVIDAIRQHFGIGWWNVGLRLYGREDINKAAFKLLERTMGALGPMRMSATSWTRGEPLEHSPATGTPVTHAMQAINWYGGRGGTIDFSPVIAQDGEAALAQFERAADRYREYGMDYPASFVVGERHLTHISAMIFDQDDAAVRGRVDTLMRALVTDTGAEGYGEYRTHLDYMDLVAQTYDWNGGALARLNETLKDALDPRGILAPGKSGIWGTAMQSKRQA